MPLVSHENTDRQQRLIMILRRESCSPGRILKPDMLLLAFFVVSDYWVIVGKWATGAHLKSSTSSHYTDEAYFVIVTVRNNYW